jgi:hypothetical protein
MAIKSAASELASLALGGGTRVAETDGRTALDPNAGPEHAAVEHADTEDVVEESTYDASDENDTEIETDEAAAETESESGDESTGDESAESAAPETAAIPAVERFEVTDHKGRRSVEINWADPKVRKAIAERAAGMRKFQVERDQANTKLKEIEPDASLGSRLRAAFEKSGVEGVFAEFRDGDRLLDEAIARRAAHKEWWAKATPEQKAAYEARQDKERESARAAAAEARAAELEKKRAEEQAAADQARVTSAFEPAFEKFRFAGKLGDANLEERLDRQLFAVARDLIAEELESLPDGAEIDTSFVAKKVREQAEVLRSAISKRADKVVSKKIETAKRDATSKAQATVKASMTKSKNDDPVRGAVQKGDMRGALKAWLTNQRK